METMLSEEVTPDLQSHLVSSSFVLHPSLRLQRVVVRARHVQGM